MKPKPPVTRTYCRLSTAKSKFSKRTSFSVPGVDGCEMCGEEPPETLSGIALSGRDIVRVLLRILVCSCSNEWRSEILEVFFVSVGVVSVDRERHSVSRALCVP